MWVTQRTKERKGGNSSVLHIMYSYMDKLRRKTHSWVKNNGLVCIIRLEPKRKKCFVVWVNIKMDRIKIQDPAELDTTALFIHNVHVLTFIVQLLARKAKNNPK